MYVKELNIIDEGNVVETLFVDSDSTQIINMTEQQARKKMGDTAFIYDTITPNGNVVCKKAPIAQRLEAKRNTYYETEIPLKWLKTGLPCITCLALLEGQKPEDEYVWCKIIAEVCAVKQLYMFYNILLTDIGADSIKAVEKIKVTLDGKYYYCENMLIKRKALECFYSSEWRRKQKAAKRQVAYCLTYIEKLKMFDYNKTHNQAEKPSKYSIETFIDTVNEYNALLLKKYNA